MDLPQIHGGNQMLVSGVWMAGPGYCKWGSVCVGREKRECVVSLLNVFLNAFSMFCDQREFSNKTKFD